MEHLVDERPQLRRRRARSRRRRQQVVAADQRDDLVDAGHPGREHERIGASGPCAGKEHAVTALASRAQRQSDGGWVSPRRSEASSPSISSVAGLIVADHLGHLAREAVGELQLVQRPDRRSGSSC